MRWRLEAHIDNTPSCFSHWVEIASIQENEKVPEYHRAFLKHILQDKQYLNGQVEWLLPDDRVVWKLNEIKDIVKSR